jgi:hypothetical protein
MNWPTATDYHEAVQNPRLAMAGEELRAGEVARGGLGLPILWSGNFADVDKIHCPAAGNIGTLKSLTRQVWGLRDRDQQIALREAKSWGEVHDSAGRRVVSGRLHPKAIRNSRQRPRDSSFSNKDGIDLVA